MFTQYPESAVPAGLDDRGDESERRVALGAGYLAEGPYLCDVHAALGGGQSDTKILLV